MIPKDKIRNLYNQIGSFAGVAKELKISPQRVHQVIKNYKYSGIKGREKKYDAKFTELCNHCHKNNSVVLHHIDGNNNNDSEENLIALCNPCHYITHKELRRNIWKSKFSNCSLCKRPIKKLNGKGICSTYCRKHLLKGTTPKFMEKTDYCISCGTKFSEAKIYSQKLFAKNMCRKCYIRIRLQTNEQARLRNKTATRKWREQNREHWLQKMREYYYSTKSR